MKSNSWTKIFVAALMLSLGLSLPAGAQGNDPFQPEPAKKKDPGDWRPEEAPQPMLEPSATPEPTPAPQPSGDAGGMQPTTAKPEKTEEERAKEERAITRNYDQAESILRKTLEDTDSEYKTLTTRINNLKAYIAKYKKTNRQAMARKRQLNVDLMNKGLYYKRQKDAGNIPDKVYQQRLKEAEMKTSREIGALDSEIKFTSDEVKQLEIKLKELEAKRKLMEAERPALRPSNRNKKEITVADRILEGVSERVKKLSLVRIKGSLGNQRLNGHP